MSVALLQKIESLSPEDQQEVARFVAFLQFRSSETDSILNEEEEAQLIIRLAEMKQFGNASKPADQVFSEMRTKYGR